MLLSVFSWSRFLEFGLQVRLMRKSQIISHRVSPSLARAPDSLITLMITLPFSRLRTGRQIPPIFLMGSRWESASPFIEVASTVDGLPRVGGESLESCGTSGVPIGRESLAVAPYLMDPATVL